jgi:hypothetical protein
MKDMKDRLEKFIKENREDFDLYEPGPNCFKGIKLRKSNQGKIINAHFLSWGIRVAAGLAIFIGIVAIYRYQSFNAGQFAQKTGIQQTKSPELTKAEAFYTSQLNNKLTEIKSKAKNNPELISDIYGEFQELDSIYAGAKNDLTDDIANKEVIDAMVQNYKMKLEILEDILAQLNRKNGISPANQREDEKKSVNM